MERVLEYGECRCCLSKGNHEDIMKEYHWDSIREVHYDNIAECFNFYLSRNPKLSTLICKCCIDRLRDAVSFKMLVLSTERQLLDMLTQNDTKTAVIITSDFEQHTEIDIKEEDIDCGEFNQLDSTEQCQKYTQADSTSSPLVDGEAALLSRFAPNSLPPLPTRETLYSNCPMYVKHLDTLKDKLITPRWIEKYLFKTEEIPAVHIRKKTAFVHNIQQILQNSNVTAFRGKIGQYFPCFYCHGKFTDIETLKKHQRQHPKTIVRTACKKYPAKRQFAYVDITDLMCTICNENMSNLDDLKNHLIHKHDKKFYTFYPDRVIPYKLIGRSDFECTVCNEKFEKFFILAQHMNCHYGQEICEKCGSRFITKYRLNCHIRIVHATGCYPCEICKKTFSSIKKYKIHYVDVHKLKWIEKCTICKEILTRNFDKKKHMKDVHGILPTLYRCNICSRSFQKKCFLTNHMRRVHTNYKKLLTMDE